MPDLNDFSRKIPEATGPWSTVLLSGGMDVVVRTPHGDADIDIVAAPTDTTLADLVRAITGQAPPATSRVDGRTVSTSRELDDLDLVIGSLIDTRPTTEPLADTEPPVDAVGFVQLTGRGAGIVHTLRPGRYRIGSARRLHAAEMEPAPVETTAFELVVGTNGAVTVVPGPDVGGALGVYTPTLSNLLLDRELSWTGGRLHVGGRLFELEFPPVAPERHRLPTPAPDGSVPFQRPPAPPPSPRPLVIGALRDAASRGGRLWQRRPTDPGAFDIPFGIQADGVGLASVDLLRHRGVALVGSDRFTAGLARTLLVEACTMHGPADLDVVVASSTDRISHWNWTKWLPHIRQGVPTATPNLFADSEPLAAWATSLRDPSAAPAKRPDGSVEPLDPADWKPPTLAPSRSPLTLLVLDDITLWSQRDSPIRSLLIDPPSELRIMALCVGLHEAPGLCTSLLEEVSPADRLSHLASITTEARVGRPALFGSLATQHTRLADAAEVVTDIRPALVEVPQAAEVARHLAPLDDLDGMRLIAPPTRLAAPTLAELVDASGRSDQSAAGLAVAIGVRADTDSVPTARRSVTLDLASPLSTIIAASNSEQHDQTVAALVLGAATQRRPDELAILIVGRERPPWHGELPHIAGWAGRDEADDAPRLVHRVAHVLAEQPELHVVVVIEHAFDRHDPLLPELITGMTELAVALPNVHVVLTADHPDSVPEASRARCGTFAWIAPNGDGTAWFADRSVQFIGVARSPSFPSPGPTEFDAPRLIVRPTTHGRAMTPLERRLSRSTTDDVVTDGDDLATAAVARQITNRAVDDGTDGALRPSLLPPPLPIEIDAATLLDRHPGDGVPIGLVDRPELAENEAYWWQPGSGGSILAAGSPRSGMTAIIELITTGVAARLAADDLHVYAIEALPQRRRAFEALPHTGAVVTPDDPAGVVKLITGLRSMMAERLEARGHEDQPDIVLLIGDVGRMRRSLAPETVDDTFRELGELAASGASVGMNVVAVTTRVDDLGPLLGLTGDRLVAPMTDPDDRARLGAPTVGPADRHPRRCWSTTADRRVQLATPAAVLEDEIERLAPEPARHQQPIAIIPAAGT